MGPASDGLIKCPTHDLPIRVDTGPELDIAAGTRPESSAAVGLAPGYSPRQRATVERAARLLAACDAALLDDGASISSFEAERRAQELRRVRTKASEALGSAVSWLE